MQNLFSPAAAHRRGQLEDCAANIVSAGKSTSQKRRTIEIAGGVEEQASVGIVPVAPDIIEVVQNRFTPAPVHCGGEFENRSCAVDSAVECRAVEIAGSVQYETSRYVACISMRLEGVQDFLRPTSARLWNQLENRTIPVDATFVADSIDVARCVKN